jgi:hypothetical protein
MGCPKKCLHPELSASDEPEIPAACLQSSGHVKTRPQNPSRRPRGICAGLVRAIDIVERALEIYGASVCVRHEIVHNKFAIDDFKSKRAVFVDELDEIPPGNHRVVFSAQGVPKSVPAEAGKYAKLGFPISNEISNSGQTNLRFGPIQNCEAEQITSYK